MECARQRNSTILYDDCVFIKKNDNVHYCITFQKRTETCVQIKWVIFLLTLLGENAKNECFNPQLKQLSPSPPLLRFFDNFLMDKFNPITVLIGNALWNI